MQIIVVKIIVTAAIAFAAWRMYDTLRHRDDPCRHCELKKNCKKFCQSKEKSYLCNCKEKSHCCC